MRTKDGFYRQIGNQISSNDYVLLAGGGVQLASGIPKTVIHELKDTKAIPSGWYRIAQSAQGVGNNLGTFSIIGQMSGRHTSCLISAGINFTTPNISVLQCDQYNYKGDLPAITQIRLKYFSLYDNNYAYLEVYVYNPNGAKEIFVKVSNFGFGWSLLDNIILTADSNGVDNPTYYKDNNNPNNIVTFNDLTVPLTNKTLYSENISAGMNIYASMDIYAGRNISAENKINTKQLFVSGNYGQYKVGFNDSYPAVVYNTQFQDQVYHPILKAKTKSGNVVNLGGLHDLFGFYGFSNETVLNENNSVSWAVILDTNNGNMYPSSSTQNLGISSNRWCGVDAVYFGKRWVGKIQYKEWCNLCKVDGYWSNTAGMSFIINIRQLRNSCAYNLTYLVTSQLNGGNVVLLSHSDYHTGNQDDATRDLQVRVVTDNSNNACYFQINDQGYHLDVGGNPLSSFDVYCQIFPISCGNIQVYNELNTTLPSDKKINNPCLLNYYGTGMPSLDKFWQEPYHMEDTKIVTEQSHILVPIHNPEVELFKYENKDIPKGAVCSIDFSGIYKLARFYQDTGYDSKSTTTQHPDSTILKLQYIIEINNDKRFVSTGNFSELGIFSYTVEKEGGINIKVWCKLVTPYSLPSWVAFEDDSDAYYVTSAPLRLSFLTNNPRMTIVATRPSKILLTSNPTRYNTGYVQSSESKNSLTYFNDDVFYIKRDKICLQLNASGLQKSIDGGANWTNI